MGTDGSLTMKDIAAHFGVSIATVSRALNDNPRISEEKRKEIQAYAREHDFSPNIVGGMLRLGKSSPLKAIGVIVPQLDHYYFSTVLSGIEGAAYDRGYMLITAQSNEMYEREVKICEMFEKNRVAGVIVSQAKDTKKYYHFQKLLNKGIPLVFYDRICTGVNASRVVVDDYMGAYNAVSHLIEIGCKRIAYYGTLGSMEIAKNRFNGYKDALLRHKMPIDDSIVIICDNRDDAEIMTPRLMEMENRPDGFFAVNDDTAIGILYVVKRMGLRVPQDISICGFTNGQRSIACDPMLTTVEQRGVKVGQEAANILIDQIEGIIPKDKVERRIVRTKLIIRGTTKEGEK